MVSSMCRLARNISIVLQVSSELLLRENNRRSPPLLLHHSWGMPIRSCDFSLWPQVTDSLWTVLSSISLDSACSRPAGKSTAHSCDLCSPPLHCANFLFRSNTATGTAPFRSHRSASPQTSPDSHVRRAAESLPDARRKTCVWTLADQNFRNANQPTKFSVETCESRQYCTITYSGAWTR